MTQRIFNIENEKRYGRFMEYITGKYLQTSER